ncbi:hypothetical protein SeMB42_g05458 [Synchytrium endobioticum]|uniref:Uncharacterized protein n=1 Tax=Synchytrium endobioticum TaxID=286115 RepID=A0A507D2U1_9FUNG|nr:hypothetical protein SeMB42_g05458 [Synchytrium endobioticum]TPX45667.1 hypothetical protein SeLEV6574_g03738 [Synchytrium endobioticum]
MSVHKPAPLFTNVSVTAASKRTLSKLPSWDIKAVFIASAILLFTPIAVLNAPVAILKVLKLILSLLQRKQAVACSKIVTFSDHCELIRYNPDAAETSGQTSFNTTPSMLPTRDAPRQDSKAGVSIANVFTMQAADAQLLSYPHKKQQLFVLDPGKANVSLPRERTGEVSNAVPGRLFLTQTIKLIHGWFELPDVPPCDILD